MLLQAFSEGVTRMPDAMEAAYDAANRENKSLKEQVDRYIHLADLWEEIAERLLEITDILREDDKE